MAMLISIVDSAEATSGKIERDYQTWPHVFWSVSLAVAKMASTAHTILLFAQTAEASLAAAASHAAFKASLFFIYRIFCIVVLGCSTTIFLSTPETWIPAR